MRWCGGNYGIDSERGCLFFKSKNSSLTHILVGNYTILILRDLVIFCTLEEFYLHECG